MDWKNFWDQQARRYSEPQAQVARISRGKVAGPEVTDTIVKYIADTIDLQPSDSLLDVCCGNGLLTKPLSAFCEKAVGVDISPAQIELARQINSGEKLEYRVGDAVYLDEAVQGSFDKICLYFSFQYLDNFTKGKMAITEMVTLLKPGGKILIGDVPEKKAIKKYYPSVSDRLKRNVQSLLGKNVMGKFWDHKEMERICQPLGVTVSRLEQPDSLPYAYYRCDYLIEKK